MVRKAGDSAATTAHAFSALSELCQIYWRPLYVSCAKKVTQCEDAQDLTQGFFAQLIETRGHVKTLS
jgi:RNA polymerase sigma-70 factor (ECF subfamily)